MRWPPKLKIGVRMLSETVRANAREGDIGMQLGERVPKLRRQTFETAIIERYQAIDRADLRNVLLKQKALPPLDFERDIGGPSRGRMALRSLDLASVKVVF